MDAVVGNACAFAQRAALISRPLGNRPRYVF
jgi:hypothetical protein